MELNDLQAQRAAKLERLRAAGLDPFPTRSTRTHTIATVLADFDTLAVAPTTLTIAGRVIGARRIMGKIAFAHVEDGTGTLQLWISRADVGDEWFARFRDDLDTFDIVQATGTLRRTKAGEASLFVSSLSVLAKAVKDGRFAFTWGIDTKPAAITGMGAFMLESYLPGQAVVLKRNPHYWKKTAEGLTLPYLERVRYAIVPNPDVELLKFMEGSIDAYSVRGMDYPLLKPLEKDRHFRIYDLG
ncbi:MAG: ABC transporter substrate-binding protein, partial [Chloroflexales bacterium]